MTYFLLISYFGSNGSNTLFSKKRATMANLLSFFVVSGCVWMVVIPWRFPNTISVKIRSPTTASSRGFIWKKSRVSWRPSGFFSKCLKTWIPSESSIASASKKCLSSGVPAEFERMTSLREWQFFNSTSALLTCGRQIWCSSHGFIAFWPISTSQT